MKAKPDSQPVYIKVGPHSQPRAKKTRLNPYPATTFAGRPLQTSSKPAPTPGPVVLHLKRK